MRIEILYFEGCPHYQQAIERVRDVLIENGVTAAISEVKISGPAAAREIGFLGSPSIRVNGVDVEPAARSAREFGMICRTYVVDGRRGGIPSRQMLREAILAQANAGGSPKPGHRSGRN